MSSFSRVWESILGSKRDKKPGKSLKSRSLRVESLEDRALLSVSPAPPIGPALGAQPVEALAAFMGGSEALISAENTLSADGVVDLSDLRKVNEENPERALVSSGAELSLTSDTLTWNLAEGQCAKYTTFKVDSDGKMVTLYGIVGDKSEIIYGPAALDQGGQLTIYSDNSPRDVTFTSGLLSPDAGYQIIYIGGTSKNDTIHLEGTNVAESFIMSQVTQVVDVHTRPSAKVQTKEVTFDVVHVRLGGIKNAILGSDSNARAVTGVGVSGVRTVTIDGKGGSDTFGIMQIGTTYDLKGGVGEDALVFYPSLEKGVRVNMGQKTAQSVISGQKGKLLLHQDQDAIEKVSGTLNKDRITTAAFTTKVDGYGGADTITLVGNEKTETTVELTGNSQKVTVKGNGYFNVTIVNGAKSTITASSHKGMSAHKGDLGQSVSLHVVATGDNIRVTGSKGNDDIGVYGNNAKVQGRDGMDLIGVTGDNANVQGGAGNDMMAVSGNNVSIQGNDGDDRVAFMGANAKVTGGKGNDAIFLYYATGNNTIDGGQGDDFLIGSAGDDVIKSSSGNNVMLGYGGADKITGGSGRNLIFASSVPTLEDKLNAAGRTQEITDWTVLENIASVYLELFNTWCAGASAKEIAAMYGEDSIIDNAQDTLKRGGIETVFYANTKADQDSVNPKEEKDTLFNNDVIYEPK